MSLKNLISSPLEAGQSVLDANRLPPQLEAALEYAARRLSRKSLRIDLVAVRREYQLPYTEMEVEVEAETGLEAERPSIDAADARPLPPTPSSATTGTSRFALAIKTLVRSGRGSSDAMSFSVPSSVSSSTASSAATSPTFSQSSQSSISSFLSQSSSADHTGHKHSGGSSGRWPFLPVRLQPQQASMPSTPATPATPALTIDSVSTTTASSVTTEPGIMGFDFGFSSGSGYSADRSFAPPPRRTAALSSGIRLVHADDLPPAHKRALMQALARAARRLGLSFGPGAHNWLAPPAGASVLGLPADLVARSARQNQVLFSGAGLVVRSLDHLYAFKAALCSYARTHDPYRLEDAVDELRRYILALAVTSSSPTSPPVRAVAKRELLRAYPTLSNFGEAHLTDVSRMYRRAYGGPEQECGIEADGLSSSPPVVTIATAWGGQEEREEEMGKPGNEDKEQVNPAVQEAEHATAHAPELRPVPEPLSEYTPTATPTNRTAAVNDAAFEAQTWASFLSRKASSPSSPADAATAPILGTTAKRMRRGIVIVRPSVLDLGAEDEAGQQPQDDKRANEDMTRKETTFSLSFPVPLLLPPLPSSVSVSTPHANAATVKVTVNKPTAALTTTETKAHDETRDADTTTPIVLVRPQAMQQQHMLPSPSSLLSSSSPVKAATPQKPLPVLKLQTSFVRRQEPPSDAGDDDEQLTARPVSCIRQTAGGFFFGPASIGQILCGGGGNGDGNETLSAYPVSAVPLGPAPPRTYDDISPITRSEWGFLMGDQMGRQVTVTTF